MIKTLSDDKGQNQRKDSYSQQDLKDILKEYKLDDNFTHPDLSVKELKKFIKQSKSMFGSNTDFRIQWDYETFKWKWMKESSTVLEFFM